MFSLFFSLSLFFGKIPSFVLRLFCCLVSDHPNEKTAEWRISFAQKKELNFENVLLFAVDFDVKCAVSHFGCLFVWSVIVQTKKAAEIQWLYFASEFDSDLEIVHQLEN